MKSKLSLFSVSLLFLLSCVSMAQAQPTRTWVSGVGDDVNPCSRTAPCKTFAGAISKTAAGGEIDTLDPGGFGAVTITKSITIDGAGTSGGILASLTNGVIVNLATGGVVVLRNLAINGAGGGLNGVRFLGGGELHLENCTIYNFTGMGVDFQPTINGTAGTKLFIKNTVLRNNANGGLLVKPAPGVMTTVTINNLLSKANSNGARFEGGVRAMIFDSVMTDNVFSGVNAVSTTGSVEVDIESSVSTHNQFGVRAAGNNGFPSTVRISNVYISSNRNDGVVAAGTGTIISFGNNRILGNNPDGVPNSTVTQR